MNIAKARRYRLRTLTRPEPSITLTADQREAHAQWQRDWQMNREPGPTPPSLDWYDRVRAYCDAKGLGTPSITVQENPADLSSTLSWAPRDPHNGLTRQ